MRDAATAASLGRAWARLTVGGVGELDGEVVEFDARRVAVAVDGSVRGALGQPVRMTLGVGDDREHNVVAVVRATTTTSDGRACLLLELTDPHGLGRRQSDRLTFAAKVDMMVVSGGQGGDNRVRGTSVDLSAQGIAVRTETALSPRTVVLLRFPVPPNRATTVQVRGIVTSCRPDADDGFVHGIRFERVGASVGQQIHAALRAIAMSD